MSSVVVEYKLSNSSCLRTPDLRRVGILRPSVAYFQTFLWNKIILTLILLTWKLWWVLNTFAASYLNTQGLNNSCLKSPASTLFDLTFQSRALRSFSLNQLRNLSLQAGNLHSSFSISSWHYLYPFYSSVCLHCDIMNPCLSLCLEGEWAVWDSPLSL